MRSANEIPEGTPAPEIMEVSATRVACDGGCGALGHPRVWLSIDPSKGWIDCGYCDRRFVLRGGPAASRAPAAAGVEPAPGLPPHGSPAEGPRGG
jgi:uncharacterized Zn-finger protein